VTKRNKPEAPKPEVVAAPVSNREAWMVMVDKQGVAYLRVAFTKAGARFIINTGREVQLIEMDLKTQKSRSVAPVPTASVLDAARIYSKPITDAVSVSPRTLPYLTEILNDKEVNDMAKAKKAEKTSAKAASKGAASKKAARTTTSGKGRKPQVTLEDRLAVAKNIIGGKKEVSKKDFAAGLKEVYPNFYSTTKRLLVEAGHLKINAETGAVSLK
jgi:hypothetical protein